MQEDAGKVLLGDAWGTSRVLIEVQQSQEKFVHVDEPSFKQDVVRVCVCLIHACVCVYVCECVCAVYVCVCMCMQYV